MKGLRLIATGGALPGRTVTNEELSRTVDTSDEWITTRTGIRTRHYCTEGENAATLAIAAAKQALQRSGLAPADIACCVCATLSAPDATPSVACQVQAALDLPEDRPALDVNAACSGFLYGIAVARGLLTTLGGQYALVIGCEALSRLMDPADRSTCVLFGDGAGAAIFFNLKKNPDIQISFIDTGYFRKIIETIKTNAGFRQLVSLLLIFSIRSERAGHKVTNRCTFINFSGFSIRHGILHCIEDDYLFF